MDKNGLFFSNPFRQVFAFETDQSARGLLSFVGNDPEIVNLGIDDDTYRALLATMFAGATSSTQLRLDGAGGRDTYRGGIGNDVYQFTNRDRVFTRGTQAYASKGGRFAA